MAVCRAWFLALTVFSCVWHGSTGNSTTLPERSCEVQVSTESGPVCGRVLQAETCTQYYSFRGIPYAKPPVGRRRFQAPEPPTPWQEPLFATVEGPACPQKDKLYGHMPIQVRGQSEDCLYLNVHVPASVTLPGDPNTPGSSGLPVLVFIPGGGFYAGSGNSDYHGPEYLMCKDVIVVTMNYRLGVLGFLSLNTADVPGNAGLRDQLAALQWVKQNIRAFGGDPDNVTLMGQSAGASSVHLLSLSEAAEGLFNRIILMSGLATSNYYTASRNYSNYVNNLLYNATGINSTDPDAIFEQLIAMPLHQIMYAASIVQITTGFVSFVPVVEDEFPEVTRIIDAEPLDLIGEGRGKDYPTLLSYTTDEANSLVHLLRDLNVLEKINSTPGLVLSPRLMFSLPSEELVELAEIVKQRYFNGTPTWETICTLYTDMFFKYPALKLAEYRAALGGAPLYLHQFGYESLFSILKYGLWTDFKGAGHIEDLSYVFRAGSALGNYVSFPPQTRDDTMKSWMTNITTNFMQCSNPTCMNEDETPWPAVTTDNIVYQNTNTTSYDVMSLTAEQRDMVAFHDSIDAQSRTVSGKLARSHTDE